MLILASSFTPEPVLATGFLVAALVAVAVLAHCFDPVEPDTDPGYPASQRRFG